ncbi:SOS response-associated peptidase [Sporolactobacillus terrae]|uniref:Abasic site processing protein n=1 Tax=Sporolactobacillus terrae TaxID=269673 RepID=A0A410DA43_9BACL|nr:SOS response-associated peptidase [Sporolactobacillus terrae]QAA22946.1 SOS response-associated peptidase [Sporolactobacillus terrae]QAA25919.1 SOS response-associated peptidase [Sporolactobacillus terrae]UAK17793.1 SOS response-associated peptidase [Sporolactobacillus terrae]BBN99344.1 putative SOS response-associated peptidase YoqW [Sporolactobacillus terrae]
MCGRFTLIAPFEYLIYRFQIKHASGEARYQPNYNVAPGQNIVAVVNSSGGNRMGFLRWGLIPSWAKDEKIGWKLINARAESIAEKPSFRHAFRRRRCLIVADSFYEWTHQTPREKVPFRFVMKSGSLFAMAGLWDSWQTKDQQLIHSCTIITTEANSIMRPIHDRMPVILNHEDEARWLNASSDPKKLLDLLRPYDSGQMDCYEVSRDVNSPRNNAPYLIEKQQTHHE